MTMNDRSPPIQYHAAMFRRLGSGVKLSRSGTSLVFEQPVCGRHDLSDTVDLAAAQLRQAGIDPEQVTAEDVVAYQGWKSGLDHARRIGGARIRISATFWESKPFNSVSLVDGLGEIVDQIVVPRIEYWGRGATNKIGGVGASCYRLDRAGVDKAIKELRDRHPQFCATEITDNSGEFGTRSR